ncbi:MAG: DNA/RNA nuclease SfsA, partial [Candidatus Bathyarchaeia archaeon]
MLLIPINFELIQGKFIRRLNRFMALAEVEGKQIHAHLPNSGRLATTLHPGVKLYLRRVKSTSSRKSAYSILAANHNNNIPVIVDAQFSNYLVRGAIEEELINGLVGYRIIRENIRPGDSNVRLDFLLVDDGNSLYLEVKSVTHVVDGFALFPDAPTLRGKRQLLEMLKLLKDGFEAGLMFSVQRPDATYIKPNCDVDPGFAN